MRELLVFFIIACLAAGVLLVSLVELAFTVRRRKAQESLEAQLKDLRAAYNESVNKLVLEGDSKLTDTDQQLEDLNGARDTDKEELSAEHKKELDALREKSRKALEKAEEKAHRLEAEAKVSADAYMNQRRKEVEAELMDLVITVSKKVLPKGISYEVHKELVTQALNDVNASKKP